MYTFHVLEKMNRLGGWLFYHRGIIPVPFFVTLFFMSYRPYRNDFFGWTLGPFFIMLGMFLRCWGIKHIGKHSRTRKRQCRKIVMSGPYALTRNPLYLGNLSITIGFTVMSELLWMLLIVIPFFLLYYTFIVFWEERILKETYPEEAERYFALVPRWWSMKGIRRKFADAFSERGDTPLREVIYRERRTWQFFVVMTILLLLKDALNNYHYPVWIPFILN